MSSSFAAFASQFLTRQQNPPPDSLSSSHPIFFSFTTDSGSHTGQQHSDLHDIDDPHIRTSSREHRRANDHSDDDDDDPYLRLDEDDPLPPRPLPDPQLPPSPLSSNSSDSSKGWLAHQTVPLRSPRSPSPSPPTSSTSSPPPDIFNSTRPAPPLPTLATTHQQPVSLSLTESLLPRDGYSRPIDVFSLPDPHHTRGRRKYNDSIWIALWCTAVSLCFFGSFLILILARTPPPPHRTLPYTTFLHTVPLLTILTFLSAFTAYIHIFLLQVFVKPIMIATSVFIPATLLVSAIWAFVGSFMWDANQDPTWGETVGLRLFALVPLFFAFWTGRRLIHLPRDIHAATVLTLTTRLLIGNPFLLALSPTILLLALLCSVPFLTLVFRLLLVGYFAPNSSSGEWHVRGWANWAIAATVAVWLWSWGVSRGVLRVTCAGVIGAWYFADPDALPPPPTSTHTIHAAVTRATSPSLGTIVLSALILTAIRLLSLLTLLLRRVPFYLSVRWIVVLAAMSVRMLEGATTALSRHALIYTGLTGDPFFVSARRAKALTDASAAAKSPRRWKREPPLTLLTVAPLTLTFPFALATYIFVAHTLGAPDQALGAAVLAAGVTGLVGLFCVGLVEDTVDTLYICYCIDKDTGDKRRPEVFSAFEGPSTGGSPGGGGAAPPSSRRSPQGRRNVAPAAEHRTVPIERIQPRRPREQLVPQGRMDDVIDIDSFEGSRAVERVRAPVGVQPPLRAREPVVEQQQQQQHQRARSPPGAVLLQAAMVAPPPRMPVDVEAGGGRVDVLPYSVMDEEGDGEEDSLMLPVGSDLF